MQRPPRKIVVSSAIDPADLDRIDAAGHTLRRSRSELIAEAVHQYAATLETKA